MSKSQQEGKSRNIRLIGFRLDQAELKEINKIVESHIRKLNQKTSCEELRVRLKQHEHGKAFLHEIQAEALINYKGKRHMLIASSSDYNLFNALAGTLDKIIAEREHKFKLEK